MQTVYYHDKGSRKKVGFRGHAAAWWVRGDPDTPIREKFGVLEISEHLYQALFNLGIIDGFRALPGDGFLDAYEEGILFLDGLADAAELLHSCARSLSEIEYDWKCSEQIRPERIEFRISVDSKTLRKELLELANFVNDGASQGYDLQLWL
jgi:hypothetical protein